MGRPILLDAKLTTLSGSTLCWATVTMATEQTLSKMGKRSAQQLVKTKNKIQQPLMQTFSAHLLGRTCTPQLCDSQQRNRRPPRGRGGGNQPHRWRAGNRGPHSTPLGHLPGQPGGEIAGMTSFTLCSSVLSVTWSKCTWLCVPDVSAAVLTARQHKASTGCQRATDVLTEVNSTNIPLHHCHPGGKRRSRCLF